MKEMFFIFITMQHLCRCRTKCILTAHGLTFVPHSGERQERAGRKLIWEEITDLLQWSGRMATAVLLFLHSTSTIIRIREKKKQKKKEKIRNRQTTKSQRQKVFATESKESETSVLWNNSSVSGKPVRPEFGSTWDHFFKWIRVFPENKETTECSLGKQDRRLEGTVWETNSLL